MFGGERSLVGERKGMEFPLVHDAHYYRSYNWGRADFDTVVQRSLDGDNVNAAITACMARWAMAYSTAPLRVYDAATDEIVRDHPLLKRLRRPNPWLSWPQFQRVVKRYKLIGGNAYIHIVRSDADGAILELYPYHDGMMTARPGDRTDGKWIRDYLFTYPDGSTKAIPTTDIIHLPWVVPSLSEPWRGESPLVSLARETGVDNEISRIVYTHLKNDACLKGYLIDPKGTVVNNAQKELIEEGWNARSSAEKRGKTPLLRGGIDFVPIQATLADLDLTPLRNVSEDRIAANFLIGNIYSGLTSGQQATTYENLTGNRQFFFEDSVVAVWQTDAEEYTAKLLPNDDRRYLWFYTKDVIALRKDLNAISTRVTTQFQLNLITRNEARAALELEPVEDALDGFLADLTPAPPPPAAPTEAEPDPEADDTTDDPPGKRRGRATQSGVPGGKSIDVEAEAKAYWKRFDDPAEGLTEKLARVIGEGFEKLLPMVLARVPKKSAKDREDWLPWSSDSVVVKLLTEAATPLLQTFLGEMFMQAVEELDESWDAVESDFDVRMREALLASTERIAETVPTVKSELQALLAAHFEDGPDALADLIKQKFTQYSGGKARTIARTTATFATNRALDDTAEELDGEKLWLTQRDGDVRDSHRKADGQRADDKGMFEVGGKRGRHPGGLGSAEEDINCRCVVRIRPKQ